MGDELLEMCISEFIDFPKLLFTSKIKIYAHGKRTLYNKLGPCPSRGALINGVDLMSQGHQASWREQH